jgi:1-acyl-sn-glycerol-3-phosphate acyltransferase
VKLITLIRSVLFAIGQITSLIFFSLAGQLLRPFSVPVRYGFMKYWALFCLWWLRITCGIKYQVKGLEHVDMNHPGLILARHESAWETLAFQKIFPRQGYVLKQELLKIPFFGWGMALLNPIAIDRGAGRKALKQILNEGSERLHSGDWVVLFPEGTRMAPNQLGKINVGGAMLAKQAKVPVYIVSHNAGSYWSKNSFMKYSGTIEVSIREAVSAEQLEELSTSDINQMIEDWYRGSFK